MLFKKEVAELLKVKQDQIALPPDPAMGDFAFPCFELAKEKKTNPADLAKELAKTIKKPDFIEEIKAIGPYLNFYLKKEKLAEAVLTNKEIEFDCNYKNKKIVIEHTAPNTNKPLHLGHLRNMFLGDSVVKILNCAGNEVIPVTVNNDRGIHICKSMLAYQKFGKDDSPEKSGMKPDHFVGKYYVIFSQKLKENKDLEKEAYELLKKWENKDPETIKLWKKMNTWAFKGFEQTYKKAGIKFEKQYYESEYYDKGKEVIQEALKQKLFKKDEEGNIIADMEKDKLGFKVVLRADGTAVYATQDIQLAIMKCEDFNADLSIYVVASEQNHYFRQLFKIFEMINAKFKDSVYHLSYGMVFLPEGKMKSREGTVVDADDLIEEVIALAKAEIELRHKDIDETEVQKRAEVIGLGALKFFMLKNDPLKDMTYNPKESVSFEGETGPYVQYAHARCASIIRKHGKKPDAKVDFSILNTPEDYLLIKKLNKYNDIVAESASHFKPSTLCHYLLELSQLLNEFYHRRKVISDDKEKTKARILLVSEVKNIINSGLSLLGITAPEEM